MISPSTPKQVKMMVVTDEQYSLCPLWQQLQLLWSTELVVCSRQALPLIKIFADLEVIWFKAKPGAHIETLTAQIAALSQRPELCALVLSLESTSEGELESLFDAGIDDIILLPMLSNDPLMLQKTWLSWKRRQRQNKIAQAEKILSNAAAQRKTNFLAWLSHEIRTPMNGLLGMAELLRETQLNTEQKELLEVMARSGQRLLHLVSEVLDLSRLEAGKMPIYEQNFNLRQLVTDSITLFKFEARQRSLDLTFSITSDVPSELGGDAVKFSQIVNNLLSNAIKYTEQGFVSLALRIEAWEGEQCRLQVEVRDSGYGIAPEESSKVFNAYEQTQSANLSSAPSSGLGLSLTKNLVELLGGTIHFHSELGKGTVFTIGLPFKIQTLQSELASESSPLHNIMAFMPEKLQGRKILVVDDDPVNLKVAGRQLRRFSADVCLAKSGVEALELLKKEDFDLLFVDCQMPDMDGFELLKIMRTLPQFVPGTPVIALTALTCEADKDRVKQWGFSDYLMKPARVEEIQNILGRWLPGTPIKAKPSSSG